MNSKWTFPAFIPRHAFNTRLVARAGDIWRLNQEIAIEGSSAVGWHPNRYLQEKRAFVLRSMEANHFHEIKYGEKLHAETWVRDFLRDTISTRELRIYNDENELLIKASHLWVYVDENIRPVRASKEMSEAFGIFDDGTRVELEKYVDLNHVSKNFSFTPWITSHDHLNHVNHPAYVDFCDELLSRELQKHGFDPQKLVPKAEKLTFRSAVDATHNVVVTLTLIGKTENDSSLVFKIKILADEKLATDGILYRTTTEGIDPLLKVFS